MTDPITREQVERATDAAYDCNAQGVYAALGAELYKDPRIPSDVLAGWRETGYTSLYRALTRWHAELVAAETPRKAPDDTAPERLRERREALGLDLAQVASRSSMTLDDARRCETGLAPDTQMRAYAAALSAAEAERAARPERPAPRFKVGDPVLVGRDPTLQTISASFPYGDNYGYTLGASCAVFREDALEPASPPAPEVVDVPQPLVIRKRLAGSEHSAAWSSDEPDVVTLYIGGAGEDAPLALLRAMLEAIDAQQQPDPQPDLDEGWRVVSGDTAFALPFGTIRECSGCGCLVSGGPTACRRCIDAQQGGAS